MKRPACKNDYPDSKRKYDSAVQPVQHGWNDNRVSKRKYDSAVQPVQHCSKTSASRAAEPASILDEDWQKEAYSACPIFYYRQNLIQAIRNAIEAGADIINISLQQVRPQSATNPDAKLLEELTSVFDAEWVSSAGQPAYTYRQAGAVMSFFKLHANLLSEKILDPDGGIPAIVLTFDFPARRLCTVTTSLPTFPRRTRERLLKAYADTATATQS